MGRIKRMMGELEDLTHELGARVEGAPITDAVSAAAAAASISELLTQKPLLSTLFETTNISDETLECAMDVLTSGRPRAAELALSVLCLPLDDFAPFSPEVTFVKPTLH